MNLDVWKSQAKAHWKQFQPARYAALQQAGMLDEALEYAVTQTHRELTQLEANGF